MTGTPDWTFAPLERALGLGLHAQNPALLNLPGIRGADPQEALRNMVENTIRSRGVVGVLRAMDLGLERAGHVAMYEVARRCESPEQVADKWGRLERYALGEPYSEFEVAAESLTVRSRCPEDCDQRAWELLLASSLYALLHRIGAQGLNMVVDGYPVARLRAGWPASETPSTIVLTWTRFQARTPRAIEVPRFGGSDPTGAVRRATQLIATDPSRSWALDDIGKRLGLSRRTLQRRLSTADVDSPGLVRQVCVHQATGLISEGHTLNEIAFLCGFADAAHFSRTFRRVMGMPPSQFREQHEQRSPDGLSEIRAALRP